MEKEEIRHLGGFKRRFISPIRVSNFIRVLVYLVSLNGIGANFEQFTVGINLLSIPKAAQFVSREKELVEMHRLLHGHSARSTIILHGLGGIGKTQLAIEYTRRYKEKYTAIFWLNANDENSLKLSFQDITQQILRDHPSASMLAGLDLDGNLDQVLLTVKA
jgi:hypothetical protein